MLNVSDLLTSVIRSLADKIVGFLIALALTVNVVLPTDLSGPATTAVSLGLLALVQLVYYIAARLIEQRWPGLGKVLLLSGKQPAYGPTRRDTPDEVLRNAQRDLRRRPGPR